MRNSLSLLLATCLANVRVDHQKMYQVSTAEPIFSCIDSFELKDDKCQQIVRKPLSPTCYEGILQADNTCLVIRPAEKECPYDHVLDGNVCRRTLSTRATLSCEEGFNFEGTRQGHSQGGICVRTLQTRQFGCPDGTYPEADYCIAEKVFPALLECPENSQPQGMACMTTESYNCNPQYVNTSGNKRHMEEVSRELNKRVKSHHENIITDVIAIPQSQVVHTCQRNVLVPALAYCDKGELMGRQCVSFERYPKKEIRPILTVESRAAIATCPPNFAPCGTQNRKHPSTDCCSTSEVRPVLTCSAGFELVGNECRARHDAEFTCAEPGFARDFLLDQCVMTQYMEPTITYQAQIQCQGANCNTAIFDSGHRHGYHH